jgi:drug/metabolite transporter (DMT)-like permease
MAVRSGLGFGFYVALMVLPFARAARLPDMQGLRAIGGSAFLGIFLGMSLMMAALAVGNVGIVATLTSTTPVLILPLIWIVTGKAPALPGWIGAGLAVLGTGLISLGT